MWFRHTLALQLGKFLWEIDQLPQAEIDSWREYYLLFPFDDYHRYHRPAALISASFGSGDMNDAVNSRLKWLAPDQSKHPNEYGWSEAELNSFRAHGVTPPRRAA